MSGSIPDSEMANYDSGPYCKHWTDLGFCEECAKELLERAGYTVIPPKKPEKK